MQMSAHRTTQANLAVAAVDVVPQHPKQAQRHVEYQEAAHQPQRDHRHQRELGFALAHFLQRGYFQRPVFGDAAKAPSPSSPQRPHLCRALRGAGGCSTRRSSFLLRLMRVKKAGFFGVELAVGPVIIHHAHHTDNWSSR